MEHGVVELGQQMGDEMTHQFHVGEDGRPFKLFHYTKEQFDTPIRPGVKSRVSYWTNVETSCRFTASKATGLSADNLNHRIEWILTEEDVLEYLKGGGTFEIKDNTDVTSFEFSVKKLVDQSKVRWHLMP